MQFCIKCCMYPQFAKLGNMMQDDDAKDVSYLPHLSFFFPTIIHCPLNYTFKNYTKACPAIVVQKIISSISIFLCKPGDTMVQFSQALDT